MILVNAEQLTKSFGMKQLFTNISLSIDSNDRIGLIGVNGTGKSTLLKVIAGIEPAEQGAIAYASGITIEYLPQNPDYEPSDTPLQHIFKDRSADLFELHEFEAKRILTKLGIDNFDVKMGELSGGGRKRVQLAAVLIRPSDLLILDEPTNHLDTDAVDWLESHLAKTRTALLMITHDRYFLDRVANRMVELDQGLLYPYTGNYSTYLEKKAERLEQQRSSELKRQNLLRNELAWMRRGAKARTTKQKARIDRFHALEKAGPAASNEELEISVAGSRLGKKVIELHSIHKAYEGRTVIHDFSYIVQKHDRIGIIGPNGRGKSTLLKLIAGKLQPDEGAVETGTTVAIGYFSQEAEELDGSQRVIDYITQAAERIQKADGTWITAAQMLELFLFPGSAQWTPIAKLSGGEKRRLYLLRILMTSPNVLLLDEPTNDLDIQTLAILEAYLDDFGGAVITVSHDRFFLDRTAETILAIEEGGVVQHFVGNYSEYADFKHAHSKTKEEERERPSSPPPSTEQALASRSAKSLKFSFNEQREYEQIDDRIAQTEQQLQDVSNELERAGSDYGKLQELTAKQQQLEGQLDQLLERWTYLNELAEAIEAQKSGK